MTFTEWVIFFLIIQIVHFLGTWKLYIKAGRKAWEAAIPVYNAVVLMRIINRKKTWWWTFLLFLPIINLIMFPVLWVETIRSFGKNSKTDTALVILTLGLYIYYINYVEDVLYIKDRDLKPKSGNGEWVSSILFAVVAATFVHTYFMQPFVIPTSSLEQTLYKGDFLFVSKFHYGARMPMTTIAAPMVHDELPLSGGAKSYSKKPQLPYFRLPGFQKIKHNDIVVFNWPVDTLVVITDPNSGYRYKPVDKRSNYVKRCVGLPGDSLQVKDGYVYINGKKNELPDRSKVQFTYIIETKGANYGDPETFVKKYNIRERIQPLTNNPKGPNKFAIIAITEKDAARIKNNKYIRSIEKYNEEPGVRTPNTFPQHPNFAWNTTQFGPIYIPKEGATIALDIDILPLYKRIISEYEGNDLQIAGEKIFINGEEVSNYTFKQDYYWMMGDNRQNSQDARMWGYVPFDHVVGKPVFKWMSIDGVELGLGNIKNWRFRWDRIFTTVSGEGTPISFFPYFLILLFGWYAYKKYKKKKGEKSA
jgi:signal peptidase I